MAVLDYGGWRGADALGTTRSRGWAGDSPIMARVVVGMLVGALIAPVLTVGILALSLFDLPVSADLPDELPAIESRISRAYDVDGNEIAVFRRFENAIPVEPDDIPEILQQAVVAAEDRRFYEHNGVDARAVVRALRADASEGEYVQGGSTITQQLVRLAYTDDRSPTLSRKLREAVLARELEGRYGKDEILYRYLSRIYLGSGNYGVGAAAESYFRKPVSELTLSESALLAGIIPAPSALDPRANPGGAENRRRRVLGIMLEEGLISDAQHREAVGQSVTLVRERAQPDPATTTVYPQVSPVLRHPYFADYLRRYLSARYGEEALYTDGLRIETSLDPRLQAAAESAVSSTLRGMPAGLEMALVSLDPQKGLVRALVGGRDFEESNVNLALGKCDGITQAPEDPPCISGGGAGRQTGSAFKPITLAAALEAGMDVDDTYSGPSRYTYPRCSGEGCTVSNTESGSYGRLTLAQATAFSVNTVFAQLVVDVGVEETAKMANQLGLTMIDPEGKLPSGEPYGPSLTLGAAEESPLDMASVFGVFAARGMQHAPSPVAKVTDAEGKVLEDNSTRRPRRVLSQKVADEMNGVLSRVITSGTGTAADIGREGGMAGKTGTSENFGDAWFVGYTPELSTSVWMGYADSRQPMTNIKGVPRVYGGTFPAETWKAYMSQVLSGFPPSTFVTPPRRTPPPRPVQVSTAPATLPTTAPAVTSPQLPYVPPYTPPIDYYPPVTPPPYDPRFQSPYDPYPYQAPNPYQQPYPDQLRPYEQPYPSPFPPSAPTPTTSPAYVPLSREAAP